jgi:hypothetical protein
MKKILTKIASTPSAPFLYQPSRDLIKFILEKLDIPNLLLQEDEFALYAQIKRGKPKKRIIVVTHLDHPAIVLKNHKTGIAFGSVGYERIHQYLLHNQIPVKIYSPLGEYQQLGYIRKFSIKRGTPLVSIKTFDPIIPNSHALWNISPIEFDSGIIKMQNADNGSVTAVAIQLLAESLENNDIDLQIIFTYLEEVHQIASTGIALRGTTPFGAIDHDTFIINLEAMELETTKTEDDIIQYLRIPRPSYENGILIKVNDGQLVYGMHFPKATNQAEMYLKHIAEAVNLKHQYTITSGSTDAKSFSLFPLSPNIATIVVPCKWKHNIGSEGEFVPEEIYEHDLDNALALLRNLVEGISNTSKKLPFSLSTELKNKSYGLSYKQARLLKAQRVRLMKAAQPRLRKGAYFETVPSEFVEFNYWRIISKFAR